MTTKQETVKRKYQWVLEPEPDSEVRSAKKRLLELARMQFGTYGDETEMAEFEEMVKRRKDREQKLELESKVEDRELEEREMERVQYGCSQPWRDEGYEPFHATGFKQWTQLHPTWVFPWQHPWDKVDWTVNYFDNRGGHSTICPECEAWLEELVVRSWDSGNWSRGYEAWVDQNYYERSVPKVEGWLEGQPDAVGQWDNAPLGNVEVIETSLNEVQQHKADAQLLRERDEYEHNINQSKKTCNRNKFDDPAGFQLTYENFVYHLDAMEHLIKFGAWPTDYRMAQDD